MLFDDSSGTILPEELERLLTRLPPPLGPGRYATGRDVLRFVYSLDIPLMRGRVGPLDAVSMAASYGAIAHDLHALCPQQWQQPLGAASALLIALVLAGFQPHAWFPVPAHVSGWVACRVGGGH